MASLVTREHERVIERVCGLAASIVTTADPSGLTDFIRAFYTGVSLEDLRERNIEDLAGAARALWRFAAVRPTGTPLVRVYNPESSIDGWNSSHTIIEIVSDDMPFIVDSITMALDRGHYELSFSAHPLVFVLRDNAKLTGLGPQATSASVAQPESFVQLHLGRVAEASDRHDLEQRLVAILDDVRSATSDWVKMIAALRSVSHSLTSPRNAVPSESRDPDDRVKDRPNALGTVPNEADPQNEIIQTRELLDWMANHHFLLLGTCDYQRSSTGLTPVPGTALGLLRSHGTPPRDDVPDDALFAISKDPQRSTVHRDTYLDAVEVRRYNDDGSVAGIWRAIGLWTSAAYNTSPVDIPILRHVVQTVVERAGFPANSHAGRDLIAILESYPRDDMFQISADDLYETAMGIVALQERRKVRVFARQDALGHFATVIVFVPRDRYTTAIRERITELLTQAFHATGSEFTVRVSQSALARVHYVLRLGATTASPPSPPSRDFPNLDTVETDIRAAIRSWPDELSAALTQQHGDGLGASLARRYAEAFPATYRDSVSVADAVADVASLEQLRQSGSSLVRLDDTHAELGPSLSAPGRAVLTFTIFANREVPLSEAMPIMVNLGAVVIDEQPYHAIIDHEPVWIERFRIRIDGAIELTAEHRYAFEAAFTAVLRGDAEDDMFGSLVLAAGMTWREAALLRAFARYLRQIGSPFSHDYIATTCATHAAITRHLVDAFTSRFDPSVNATTQPDGKTTTKSDHRDAPSTFDQILVLIDAVPSLDDDRILRSILNLIASSVRTNWFQRDESANPPSAIAIKFDPSLINDLPRPIPSHEIFVTSPRVEGVHLRMGAIARGGLRWSDRREDFRTEILGLVKAQTVKNAVIVPVGAKGGFVAKQLPAPSDRDAWLAEGIAAYRVFVGALLDLTDNLVDGVVVQPTDVVHYDGDDHYLVVAADKGTATFSDIANALAIERGFWLGDAFASGGSAGYDHKAMGITARGAWESVRSHFRQLGIDTQSQDFTVVGIGDMSGDVFGNGMLLSTHICLVAAFDHRHIFFDPTPDPAVSFGERERLFSLARSSWAEYDPSLISPGGGVFDRSAKSIPVTDIMRSTLGIDASVHALSPIALIAAILRAPIDLLWNGGIGTYVKASSERNNDVGDKANDNLRVDASTLRCRVVGEGGNLGFTQRARVEFAQHGGSINTDAIDNSAGVDTSDHEVNIKILVDTLVRKDRIAVNERDATISVLTDDVARRVLVDNYGQNRALSIANSQSAALAPVHREYLCELAANGTLDRELEFLPTDEALRERIELGKSLTVPELAVLFAYTKIELTRQVAASPIVDDVELAGSLTRYFPDQLVAHASGEIEHHPLRRQIIATTLVNEVVNSAGMTLAFRLHEETAAPLPTIVAAYATAWHVFDQQRVWDAVAALDTTIDVGAQHFAYLESRKLVERATRWLLRSAWSQRDTRSTIDFFSSGVARCAAVLPNLLRGSEHAWIDSCTARLTAQGMPFELAREIAHLDAQMGALDIVETAHESQRSIDDVASVRALVGDRMHVDWLLDRILHDLPREERWSALARDALRDDATREYRRITTAVLTTTAVNDTPEAAFVRWADQRAVGIARLTTTCEEIRAAGVMNLATLSVALRTLRLVSE